jgi:uncharacterized protein
VEHDPGLLNARDFRGMTPLMRASQAGQVQVVRWLLDHGAAVNERCQKGCTALYLASWESPAAVVGLLMERGGDPTVATEKGRTPLLRAAPRGRLEVVRLLLGHPGVKSSINHRDDFGQTTLLMACYRGSVGAVRALLESGADPTIASSNGSTPIGIAKNCPRLPPGVTAEGRQECVVALEVRFRLPSLPQNLLVRSAG